MSWDWKEGPELPKEPQKSPQMSPKSMRQRRKSKEEPRTPSEDSKSGKRVIASPLKRLLIWDADLTNMFVHAVDRRISKTLKKSETKAFEISCSGYVWLPGLCLALWFLDNKHAKQIVVNLLVALLMDVAIIAVIKAFARRRRPPSRRPDFFGSVGPDKFSFPSGHASRSVLLAIMFTQFPIFSMKWYFHLVFAGAVWGWALLVSLSRIINGRHFILDVAAGMIFGYLESYLAEFLWMNQFEADKFLTWFYDDSYDDEM